jgi:hypothetical protein
MSLASDLRRFAEKSNQKMETVIKSSLIRVGSSIVAKTPVRDGTIKNNWMSAYGAIDTTVTRSADPSGAQSEGRLRFAAAGVKVGESFYFTNSLPYAYRIEYEGWSEGAKFGMVRISIAAWENIVADEVAKTR